MIPEIGIVILNWNGWRDTFNCLDSLRQVNYPARQIEIIVVDNGSCDESVERLHQQPGITVLELPTNVGFAAGSNIGIRHALAKGCEYILLLNNDTVVLPDFLTPLLQVFKKNATAGIVSPKIRYKDQPNRLWYAGGRFQEPRLIGEMVGLGQIDQGQHNQACVVDFAVGCCMLIHRAVFEQIGYLDERFFFYHEDVDFSLRVTRAGFSVWYQPASVILHQVSQSTQNNLPARTFLEAQSRVVFFAKHIRGFKLYLVIGLEIVRFIRRVAESLRNRQPELAWSYARGLFAGLGKLKRGQSILR